LCVDFFPVFEKKGDHGSGFAFFPRAKPDQQIAIPQYRAAPLIDPQLASYPMDIKILHHFQPSCVKKDYTAPHDSLIGIRHYPILVTLPSDVCVHK
jgi:hypothetical protein